MQKQTAKSDNFKTFSKFANFILTSDIKLKIEK